MATPRLPKSGEPEGAYRILPFLVRFTNRREGEAGADEEVTPTFSNRLAWLIVVPAVERGNTSAGKPPQGLASAWSSFVDASTGEWLFSVTTSPLADYR